MTDIYEPNWGDDTSGDDSTNNAPPRVPLKDLNGDIMYHVNPDGSLGAIWYTDEPPPSDWNASGDEPDGSDVAKAVEAVGNNPDAIKNWLTNHNFPTDKIPPPDFTPNVDDDFTPPA